MARIDHVLVFCRRDAPERQLLVDHGLAIGREREHQGQGTRNACIGFGDGYLELLWLADDKGARNAIVKPLGLHERARWREHAASPFGICVRPDAPGEPPPFVSWDYRPSYLPDDVHIAMGCNSGVVGEPLLFHIDRPYEPFAARHPLAAARIAAVTVTVPDLAPMSLLHELAVPGLTVRAGDRHLLELSLTGADGSGELDLGEQLPLVLRW